MKSCMNLDSSTTRVYTSSFREDMMKMNYDQLDALFKISGLQNRDNPQTTEKAHQTFMQCYPRIFSKEKPVLPGIPEKRTKGVHCCDFSNDKELGKDSHNIHFHLNKFKSQQTSRSHSPKHKEKLYRLIKILRKIPILRTDGEHEMVYKTLKMIPDINDQLSDAELKDLSMTVVKEHWVKGSAVFMKGGEISKYVGFIKSGCCNAYQIIPALVKRPLGKMMKQMRQVLIGQLNPRESFGEASILLQVPSTYTLKAATPVELGLIEAADILDLDPVIQMLLLQTIKPPFENVTHDDLKLEYVKSEIEKEWKHKKEMILKDVMFYNGISPGVGKWVHEHICSHKNEKKPQECPLVATYEMCVEQNGDFS